MLETLRAALLRRSLRKALAAQKRRRKANTLTNAQSIGLLFDATAEKDRKDVLQFARTLEEQGKKVRLLGFIDTRTPLGQTLFPQFTQNDFRWTGQPRGEAISAFISERFDVMLCLNTRQTLHLEWVAAAAQAGMKIGTSTDKQNDFDMVLETPAEKGVQFFVDQLDFYLDKIVPSKNEHAAAL